MTSTINQPARQRPGGRTANTSDRIFAAVVALLVERGVEECTFTNVAARARVERSTLYRRYADRWAMIGEALFAVHAVDFAITPTGDFRADMTAHLRKVGASLDSTTGRAMVVAAAMSRVERSPEGGRYWANRRRQLEPIIAAAVTSRAIRPVEPDELFAASDGPLFFRMLIANVPIDDAFIHQVVENLCRLYGVARKPGRVIEPRGKETAS